MLTFSRRVWCVVALSLLLAAVGNAAADDVVRESLEEASSSYDPYEALNALYYCKSSYCDAAAIAKWNCASCPHHPHFTDVSVYHNNTWDSQTLTGYDPTRDQVVVAFRGSSNIPNWIADFDFFMEDYPNKDCGPGVCKVHTGFYNVYLTSAYDVLRDVQRMVTAHPNASILVTGHSLGAAVSLHAAVDIALKVTTGKEKVMLYNFGEPRDGNPAFAAWAASVLPQGKQFRVTHEKDPVPHLPPELFGFMHAPHELWYNNDGNTTWHDCKDSQTAEDPHCSDGQLDLDVDDHLKYLGIPTGCEF